MDCRAHADLVHRGDREFLQRLATFIRLQARPAPSLCWRRRFERTKHPSTLK
jgi:hypothetical protein